MKRLALASIAILALTAPTLAAGSIFIPIGPPIYTPQPDIVTPQPDIVTPQPPTITETEVIVKPATHDSAPNTSLQSFGHCPPMRTMNGGWTARTNVNADCTALSINPGGGGFPAVKRIDTTVTENPDIVTPQPDLVTPQPDKCSQPGISIPGGFGSRDC